MPGNRNRLSSVVNGWESRRAGATDDLNGGVGSGDRWETIKHDAVNNRGSASGPRDNGRENSVSVPVHRQE